MRLQGFKRIYRGDFPEDTQNWIDRLAFIVNNGIEQLYQALGGQLTVEDNFLADEFDLTITVANANGDLQQPVRFTLNKLAKLRVSRLEVGRATVADNSGSYPTSAPWLSFQQSSSSISILNVKGLPVGIPFTIRVVAWP